MSAVLVTGGAGFIGSHLVDALITRSDDVAVLDNLAKGRRERLPAGAEFFQADLTDRLAVAEVVEKVRPAVIFHLAAQADVRVSVDDPLADAAVNVLGTIDLLQQARRVGARVVFASTGGAIYGETERVPTPETEPPRPEAPYGTAKLCAEEYLRLFNRLHGTTHTALRFANVYGPRQDPWGEAGVVSIFCGAAARGTSPAVFGDGRQTRDYVYVGDVVRALLAAADRPFGGAWNVGTGVETSVLDLLDVLAAVSGRPVRPDFRPARAGELQRSALDCRRAADDLGWTPATSLAAGVAAVYRWIRDGEAPRAAA
jgi:UDP-glucose 4-epimerase